MDLVSKQVSDEKYIEISEMHGDPLMEFLISNIGFEILGFEILFGREYILSSLP